MLCCPRQIAAVLKRDFGEVCSQLDDVEQRLYSTGDWRERGCTGRMVIEYAKAHGHGACVLHEDRVVETLPGPNALVCAIHENHSSFYSCKRARKTLMQRQAQNVQKVKRQFESSKTPQFAEWVHWSGIESMAPGH